MTCTLSMIPINILYLVYSRALFLLLLANFIKYSKGSLGLITLRLVAVMTFVIMMWCTTYRLAYSALTSYPGTPTPLRGPDDPGNPQPDPRLCDFDERRAGCGFASTAPPMSLRYSLADFFTLFFSRNKPFALPKNRQEPSTNYSLDKSPRIITGSCQNLPRCTKGTLQIIYI